jgi:hypothetical protein
MVKEGNRKLSCKLEAKDKIITVNKQHLQYKKSVTATGCLDAADRITETESESFQSLFTLELKNAMQ